MKLKKSHVLTAIVFLIVFLILFYPRILPPLDVRSTTPVIVESPKK